MAQFTCNDIGGLALSMSEMAALPAEKIHDIVMAGAKVVKKYHTKKISSEFASHTGRLAASTDIKSPSGAKYALIYPVGQHHTYKARKGGTAVARNADVGFVQEFGGHGNAAHQWMREANEESLDEMTDAEEKEYDAWLKSLGL